MKKIISLVMAMAMVLSMGAMSFAAVESSGGSGDASLQLTTSNPTAPTTFSVTVPTTIAFSIAANGTVTAPSDVAITNNSAGMVKVTNVAIADGTGWTGNNFDSMTPYSMQVDSKNYAVSISAPNASDAAVVIKTTGKSALSSSTPAWRSMHATGGTKTTLPLTLDGKFSAFSDAQTSTTFATVTFTIAWDSAA